MRKLIFLFIAATCFLSCQKEIDDYIGGEDNGNNNGGNNNGGGTNTGSLTGTWDFVALNAETATTNEFSFLGLSEKLLAVFNYSSTDNTGTITFDDDTVTSANVSYAVEGDVITYTYENGVLQDSVLTPTSLDFAVPDQSVKYVKVSNDSLYFPDGFFTIETSIPDSGIELTGVKYSFNGDTLKLSQVIHKDSTSTTSGIDYQIQINARANILLKKH